MHCTFLEGDKMSCHNDLEKMIMYNSNRFYKIEILYRKYKEINIKIVRLDVSSSGDQKNDKNPFTISLQTELNNADEFLKKSIFK